MPIQEREFIQCIIKKIDNGENDLIELHKILHQFKNSGMSKDEMLKCLEQIRGKYEAEQEDLVLDLMDFVTGFCSLHMQVYRVSPHINMELYETEKDVLQKFMDTVDIRDEISEMHLILYNFATDCKYAKQIQPELIQYLLPFYLKCATYTTFSKREIAMTIYIEFNTAMIMNHENFIRAIGLDWYQNIMEYYVKETLLAMSERNTGILAWVSLFNTTVALDVENINKIFGGIKNSALDVKYAFFAYISVLLFKESDNMLATANETPFWSSDIWNFDCDSYKSGCFWSEVAVKFFDETVTRQQVENLFDDVKSLLLGCYGDEILELLEDEMHKSFETGIFEKRKREFLSKIGTASEEENYWDATF